jgi:hypothetical protein
MDKVIKSLLVKGNKNIDIALIMDGTISDKGAKNTTT